MNLSEVFRSAAGAIIEREGVQEISAILIITAILTSIECLGNFWREVCTRADKHQIRNVWRVFCPWRWASSREGDRVIGESRFLLQQLSFSVLINLRQLSAPLLIVINRILEVRSARAVSAAGHLYDRCGWRSSSAL